MASATIGSPPTRRAVQIAARTLCTTSKHAFRLVGPMEMSFIARLGGVGSVSSVNLVSKRPCAIKLTFRRSTRGSGSGFPYFKGFSSCFPRTPERRPAMRSSIDLGRVSYQGWYQSIPASRKPLLDLGGQARCCAFGRGSWRLENLPPVSKGCFIVLPNLVRETQPIPNQRPCRQVGTRTPPRAYGKTDEGEDPQHGVVSYPVSRNPFHFLPYCENSPSSQSRTLLFSTDRFCISQ